MTQSTPMLAGRTILVSPDDPRELTDAFKESGARVIVWPPIEFGEAANETLFDEAIDNLFGYDWIVFSNVHSVEFFLRRFSRRGHQTNELDELRIWALGTLTAEKLEGSQVHVDLVTSSNKVEDLVTKFKTFLPALDSLTAMNFLLPRAAHSCEALSNKLEELGARVDVVIAYRTVANESRLVQLKTLLGGGGVDCIVLRSVKEMAAVAELFDTADLSLLFRDVIVAGVDQRVVRQASWFGLKACSVPSENITALTEAVSDCFRITGNL